MGRTSSVYVLGLIPMWDGHSAYPRRCVQSCLAIVQFTQHILNIAWRHQVLGCQKLYILFRLGDEKGEGGRLDGHGGRKYDSVLAWC